MHRQMIAKWSLLSLVLGMSACSMDTDDSIATTQQAALSAEEFAYFRCNATSWAVDDASRLKDWIAPGMRVLVYEVTEEWMVSGADSCAFTITNEKNGWGTSQKYMTPVDTQVVEPPASEQLSTAPEGQAPQFSVDYPALGKYRLLFGAGYDPQVISIEHEIGICSSQHCPSPTHCELSSAGIPICAL